MCVYLYVYVFFLCLFFAVLFFSGLIVFVIFNLPVCFLGRERKEVWSWMGKRLGGQEGKLGSRIYYMENTYLKNLI